MELFNKAFYLSFAVVVLVIYLGSFSYKEIQLQNKHYHYWPTALLLMVASNLGFFFAGIEPAFFLAVGNASLVFSGIAIVLFIRSWDASNSNISRKSFWIAYFIFLLAYEFLRVYASFNARVYLMTGLLGVISLIGLVETFLLPKRARSAQVTVLKGTFFAHLLLVAVRAFNLTYVISSGSLVSTIYQESAITGMLRALGVASNLLIYLAISNILLEKVWRKEEKKSATTEKKMLASLNSLAMARDNETGAHIVRTKAYVRRLALRLREQGSYADQLSSRAIEQMADAAPLHDIGKVGIPDQILYKQGPLTKEEWGVMKTHAFIGESVLTSTKAQLSGSDDDDDDDDDDVIDLAIQIAGGHHEQWAGGGYPRGLKGQAIPLPARIMALADTYDALISERVYKNEWTHDQAVSEILSKKGIHFDPFVVEAFMQEQDNFKEIAQRHKDEAVEGKAFRDMGQTVEQKFRRSEEKFEFLFKHSPIGMALVSHATGDFIEVNDALLAYTQYTKAEFLKLSFWDITPPEYADQEAGQIEQLNSTGSFGPNYKEYIRKDGSRFPISIRGFILSDADGQKVVWGIIEDLSEIKPA